MMRLFVSLILLCECAAAFSASTKNTQELFPQPDAPRRTVLARRLNAANQANPQADLSLAKALYRGTKELRRNYREACRLFAEISARGSAEATAWLGSCYIYGRGVEKDTARGVSLTQTSAQADDAVGLMFLGELYEDGNGVARNYAKAADLFSRAVSKGYAPAYARLGNLYRRGLGVNQKLRTAFELFKQGAQMGDPSSQFYLGQLAFKGFISPRGEFLPRRSSSPNYEMALQYFSQAADQGNWAAAFMVAQMYEYQLGVAQDRKKAGSYYMQSARAGDLRAQLAMGRLNEKGGPRGQIFSYAWYKLSHEPGKWDSQRLSGCFAS